MLVVAGAQALWIAWNNQASDAILERLHGREFPTDTVELNRWYAPVAARENRALALLDAAAVVRNPATKGSSNFPYFSERGSKRALPGVGIPNPIPPDDLVRWKKAVEGMPEVWEAMERARGRRLSRYPVDLRAGPDTLLPHLARLKSLSQACALRALVAAGEGRLDLSAHALGDGLLITESLLPEPILISQLVSASTLSILVGAMTDVLSQGPLPPDQLAGLGVRLAAMLGTNSLRNALVGEMAIGHWAFQGSPARQALYVFGQGGSSSSQGAPFVASLMMGLYSVSGLNALDRRHYLTRMEGMIDATGMPWPAMLDASSWAKYGEELGATPGARVFRGRVLSGMLLLGLGGMTSQEAERIAKLRLGITLLAVERYRAAKGGHLPSSLDELVPGYLPAVPIDPFDGLPLRFLRMQKGYSLHSVGRDRKDDGASRPRPIRSRTAEPDMVLRVYR